MKIRLALAPVLALALPACGGPPEETAQTEEALVPATIMLPLLFDYRSSWWVTGNYHGSTNNPYPDYCRTGSNTPRIECVDDMQEWGDSDFADFDHIVLSRGFPGSPAGDLLPSSAPQTFIIDSLRNEVASSQWNQITAIDQAEVHMVASVSPPPGNSESVILQINGVEVGDPPPIAQDGAAHEVVWTLPTNPYAGRAWDKLDFDGNPPTAYLSNLEWGFTNANRLGPSRKGAFFVHSFWVTVSYR